MEAILEYNYPDSGFWNQYQVLWEESNRRSVFQGPAYLKHLASYHKGPVAVFKFFSDKQLKGAAIFRKENGVYGFLSDIKSDHNFFVLHKDCTPEETEFFFGAFFEKVRKEKWALLLNSQPAWAEYMPSLQQAGRSQQAFFQSLSYSVCPVFEAQTPEEMYKRFNKSKNTRYKLNRLKKEQDAVFEFFRGDEDLREWIREFGESHGKRWEHTPTPSKYADADGQAFLYDCCRAWIEDDVLIRFSIRVGDTRIAFCIGLIQGQSLVHHSHTYDVEYSRYSPGKVLLHAIGEWMKNQKLTVLDFGDGDESFKYLYANKELHLYRIFTANKLDLPFIIKAKLIKSVKQNKKIYDFYREKIRPYAVKMLD